MSALDAFLARAGWAGAGRRPLAGDASGRRYLRLRQGAETAVLMQAPADASLDAFLAVGRRLAGLGLSVPRLIAEDRAAGLLLIEDFGDDVFARLLAAGQPAGPLYDLAVDVLIHLHRRFVPARGLGLPVYDAGLLEAQVMLFVETALAKALEPAARAEAGEGFRRAWAGLLPAACRGPGTLVLRDYHAGNLIRLAGRPGIAACGLLDYQDAGLGPRAYDLVSLLEDARLEVPEAVRRAAVARYLAAFPELEREAFERASTVLALQRHFRVVAVFHRLAEAAGKRHYLAHLPRLWRLIAGRLAEPAAAPLQAWAARWLTADRRRRLGADAA